MAISQNLAEPESKLSLLIRRRDALHLDDCQGLVVVPREVEVRFVSTRRSRLKTHLSNEICESILCRSMATQSSLDEGQGHGQRGRPLRP